MISIDYNPRSGYYFNGGGKEKYNLTGKEVLEYLQIVNSNCSYINISQGR